MSRCPRFTRPVSLLITALLALPGMLACTGDEPTAPAAPSVTTPDSNTSLEGPVVLVGAGNIARCDRTTDEATAKLLDGIPGTIFTTGDNVYTNGSYSDFSNCFGSSWGRHRARIRPAVGDTEYGTSGAAGYFGYFGAAAGNGGQGWYSYNAGNWHVVVLNSQLAMSPGSPQEVWLRADLAMNTRQCIAAIWHHPRFSSYATHTRAAVKPLWDALYAAGADIVINGHYRFYERFAPQNPDGKADPAGMRQFIVGTGGTGSNPFDTAMPNSEVRKTGVFGVLKLTLDAGSYTWEFVPTTGGVLDRGTGSCNGTGSSAPPASGNTIASVELTPPSISIAVDGKVQLTAVPRDAAGKTVSGASVGFASTNANIATVAANGVVTGVAIGVASVIATSGGVADTTRVTVTPSLVNTVSISPATVSLTRSETKQLTAVARDAMGNTLSVPVTWTSTDPATATVSATGMVTGMGLGTATIRAVAGSVNGTATVTVSTRRGYFAAPNGTSSGDGSWARPWSLATALAGGGGRVQPGDTIWLRGGTYRGSFRSTVSGRSGSPVVVRGYPGERAIIDGAGSSSSTFYVGGSWSVFWGFEVMNSNTTRSFSTANSHSRANAVVNYASNTRYVNLVVHDGGVGFYTEPQYTNVEIAGCIFYNNGWQSPSRGHGHAIYLKSHSGPVIARDNVMFNQFGYGIHVYTNAGSGKLNNIRLVGNVSFNNGTVASTGTSPNILLGGDDTADDDVVQDNFTWFSPGLAGTNVKIGYSTLKNGDVKVSGNYFAGGSQVLDLGYWASAQIASNTFVGNSSMIRVNDGSTSGKSWSGNTHYRDPSASAWRYTSASYTFSQWRSRTGAAYDQATNGSPTATRVFVRQNPYETDRAMVVVYNWSRLGSVTANLSGILKAGDRYVVRSVQNLHGSPVASGTYGGSVITIPITSVAAPAPIGWSRRGPATAPNFDVYIVTKD